MICPPSVFAHSAPCAPQMGGIKSVLVADPDAVGVAVKEVAGTASLSAVTPGAKPFFRWEVAPGQNTLVTEAKIDEANNVKYFATDLSAALNGFDATTAGVSLLARLTRLLFIVECKNGTSFLVGCVAVYGDARPAATIARGADVTCFNWTPGQANSDAVRATVSAHLDSFIMPPVVSGYSALVND